MATDINEALLADLNFFAAFDGLNLVSIDFGTVYQDYPVLTTLLQITAPVAFSGTHPVLDTIDGASTIAIPSPASLLSILVQDEAWRRLYDGIDALIAGIADTYSALCAALADRGVKTIRFQDYAWPPLLDNDHVNLLIQDGVDIEHYTSLLLDANNLTIGAMPESLKVELHIIPERDLSERVCGDYALIAPVVFAGTLAHGICLDYNIDVDNDFAPLASIPADKSLCLVFYHASLPPATDSMIDKQVEAAAKFYKGGEISHELHELTSQDACDTPAPISLHALKRRIPFYKSLHNLTNR